QGGARPLIVAQHRRTAGRCHRFQERLVDRHLPRAFAGRVHQQSGHKLGLDGSHGEALVRSGVHLSTGCRAARTSSGRLIAVLWGASRNSSSGSWLMLSRASAKASSVSLVSVSVGSIIIASRTIGGK